MGEKDTSEGEHDREQRENEGKRRKEDP